VATQLSGGVAAGLRAGALASAVGLCGAFASAAWGAVVSETIPVRGGITVDFHGDPATGCAAGRVRRRLVSVQLISVIVTKPVTVSPVLVPIPPAP
jgi:hypothetical protein